MREIKFRAWALKGKKMFNISTLHFFPNNYTIEISDRARLHILQPNEIELMQFTGLKDKNGKEIYEGDILESRPKKDVRFEVCFGWNTDGNTWGWCLKSKDHTYSMDDVVNKMEVIGNIYENPELINKEAL